MLFLNPNPVSGNKCTAFVELLIVIFDDVICPGLGLLSVQPFLSIHLKHHKGITHAPAHLVWLLLQVILRSLFQSCDDRIEVGEIGKIETFVSA